MHCQSTQKTKVRPRTRHLDARLMNEFTEDEKYYNLMRRFILFLCDFETVQNFMLECEQYEEIRPYLLQNEPPHDKTNKMACEPSEDSDQPEHPPSLIRFFAVRMKKAWVLSYVWGGCPGWSESSLGAHAVLLVSSWNGSNLHRQLGITVIVKILAGF